MFPIFILFALLALAAEYDAEWEAMAVEGAVLNEYIVAGGYPGDIVFEDIGKVEAEEALDAVRRIRARAKSLETTGGPLS